ncbi:MAG: hypothetical protein JOZ54_23060 [Acidobacteria bacterium]|nr:hypothetical protein [Acidobacteriota bacterium]
MQRWFIALLVFLTVPLVAQQVTMPLAEYERLRRPEQAENVTVVDTIRLTGSFKERNLLATFVGKSVGKHPAASILEAADGALAIWGCSGNALITRAESAFQITPLADSFSATCRIGTAGSDRLELHATSDVLAIDSALADGDLASAERNADGSSRWTFVRQSGGGNENLAATATGHYLVTLLPEETRFRYAIVVHNPNRSRRAFEVRLRSGEHLQQVDAAAAYEVVDGAYRFDVPPGDITLVLTGQFTGDTFTPPVDASVQYLAIENHPIVRPMIAGTTKRISAGEVDVPIQFRGPQAFLLGKGESLRWTKTKLEVLHTVSYAVSSIQHQFFVPTDGPVLGESVFGIDNQGASDVKLPLAPEPTYVSIQNEALLMTKGADGQLTVPLSAGRQDVLVQHRQSLRHFLGFGIGKLTIPQLSVPATALGVVVSYPHQWLPLVQSFSSRTIFWSPSVETIVLFLVLLLWTERMLAFLGLPLGQRGMLAVSLALTGSAIGAFAVLVGIGDALLTVLWLMQKRKWWKTLLATGVALVIGALLIGTFGTRTAYRSPASSGAGLASGRSDALTRNANVNFAPQEEKAEADYQGLPARFQMPTGEREGVFSQDMLSADREHPVTVLLISSGALWVLGALLVAISLLIAWRARRAIVEGVQGKMASPELVTTEA